MKSAARSGSPRAPGRDDDPAERNNGSSDREGGRTAASLWKERLRAGAAVLAGLIAWTATATAGNLVLRVTIDGYRAAEPAMAFSVTMMIGRLALGVLASATSGGVARWAAGRSSIAPWGVAIVLITMFLPAHIALWSRFPLAYHLFFLASLVTVPPLAAAVIDRHHR